MLDRFTLLASASGRSRFTDNPFEVFSEELRKGGLGLLHRPDDLLAAVHSVNIVWCGVFVAVGAICLFQGYRWRKVVVLALAALGGMWAGTYLEPRLGDASTIGSVALAALFALLALPLMKFTVALFGGLAGAFLGANVWIAVMPPEQAAEPYIGALIGLIVLGMLAFLAFRVVIIAFTAVIGAFLLVVGSLGGLTSVELWSEGLERSLTNNPRVLPLITGVLALIGGVIQQGNGVKGLVAMADKCEGKKKGGAAPAPAQPAKA